ncbi:MAG: hypothetical protein COT43_04090 [Candidatus Marinimicrobia bacterium CG08_land_8_20_14_0_20_45_22]|nr:MAG: hypothetical protein COT43_04090 [Candidatus Marinimicrobia bacterium CG08_land_8_20_14_0_20_45_22]
MKFNRVCLIMIAAVLSLSALDYDFRGQLSARLTGRNLDESRSVSAGLQYIPQFSLTKPLNADHFISAELAFYGFANSDEKIRFDNIQPYRLNFRYATAQTETQIGLQKINFGPAQILRSLMWFDRLDPRDPMKITEGVYGLRFRHNYLNNANAWLWVLYGNEETKGYEAEPTTKGEPEFGGRFQIPVRHGEVALTYHQRYIEDAVNGLENRLALDGRWDFILGWWIETVGQFSHDRLQSFTTLGADYTFGIGNGLYTLFEHKTDYYNYNIISVDNSSGVELDDPVQVSAIMLTYPLMLFDNLTAIGYYSWTTHDFYQYIGWQRTYDKIVVNLNFFNYPDAALSGDASIGAGKGLQLILIYNH